MDDFLSDVAFTASVKAVQRELGSREAMQRMAETRDFSRAVTDDLAAFLAQRDSFYLATASAAGQPYIQHRGGPPGFLKVLDARTLGFADFKGNRQFITQGNLVENNKAHLFLIDYVHRRRVKIWGRARIIEDDPTLIERLMPENYRARPEQALLFDVDAWDVNCPQHIPQRFEAEDVERALAVRDARIAALEAELASLRQPPPTEG